eukprot:c2301_g1_i2.p1 GENE.c2301_g1_i2~~c2301_g1_i2.p1  ORF type:complete len:234 (+),score=50.08 c2301_g1_i2:2-703(+)
MGFIFDDSEGFRYIFVVGGVLSVVYGIGTFFLPDSARWLVLRDLRQKGQVSDEARFALMKVRGAATTDEVAEEIADVRSSVAFSDSISSFSELLKSRNQFIVVLGCVIFQQITGQTSVLYHLDILVKSAVGDNNTQVTKALCLVYSVRFFGAMIVVSLVDRIGRKMLLLVGIGGMVVSTIALTISFHVYGDDSNLVTILFLVLYLAFYQVCFIFSSITRSIAHRLDMGRSLGC